MFSSYRRPVPGEKVVRVVVELSPLEAELLRRMARFDKFWGHEKGGHRRGFPTLLDRYTLHLVRELVRCAQDDAPGDQHDACFRWRWLAVGRSVPDQS